MLTVFGWKRYTYGAYKVCKQGNIREPMRTKSHWDKSQQDNSQNHDNSNCSKDSSYNNSYIVLIRVLPN